MFTKIKLLLILLCLSISAVAETHYNSVHSVTLNNTDLTNSISMAKAVSLIKGRGIEKKAVFSECTVNYDMEIRFPGKKLRLEFFPEENPSVDLQKIFSKKNLLVTDKNKLKAQLWVYWDNMNAFTESLKVGNVVIKPNMTFNQFKTFFPISAQKSEAHFKNLYMQEGTYHVLVINIPISEVEEPPYVPSVAFTFKKGKLNKLAILSGVAC